MDAQDCFADMVKRTVAPGFRAMGFRGSGRNFHLPNDGGHHALMALSKSRYNWRESCRFGISLTFWSRDDWALAGFAGLTLPARPTANVVYGRMPTWLCDLGELMDPPHGHSWTISGPEDVGVIADHVLGMVRDLAVPALTGLAAGGKPPPPPRVDPNFDCPWPFCTNPLDRYDQNLDADTVPEPVPPSSLSPTDRDRLARAALTGVRRSVAWKVVHVSRAKLDRYLDFLGAGDESDLTDLLAIACLGVDGDFIDPAAWRASRDSLAAWLTAPDETPEPSLLVSGADAALVTGLPMEFGTGSVMVVMNLLERLQELLSELEARGLI